jgi:hypothetical protein
MGSPNVHEGQRPFVVGIDKHSSDKFFQSTDPVRFQASPMFRDERNWNDYANHMICMILGSRGIDCVFSSYAERVLEYIREKACRAVMFHTRLEDMSDTTSVILKRRNEIRLIFLYSPSQLYGPYAQIFEKDGGFKEIQKGLYENDDKDLAVVKPDGIVALADHLKDLFQDILIDV